jgi:hypothetical protein
VENDDSDDETQFPNLQIQRCYDALKFVSLLVYQLTLVTFLSYYVTSRFANIYIKELFYMFLVSRPIVIATYTTFSSCCSIKNARYITRTLKREKLAEKSERIAMRAKARQ